MSTLGLSATLLALALITTCSVGVLLLGAWHVAWTLPVLRERLRRTVPLVMLLPAVIGGAVVLAATLPTLHGCHCELDPATAIHLCFAHPDRSLALLPPSLLVLAAVGLRALPRAVRLVQRTRATLALAPGRGVFARVARPVGNALSLAWPRPRIVVDRGWWDALRPADRRIVLAHEGAHLRRGDPILLELLELSSWVLPRLVAGPCVGRWREHAEKQADAAAARATGDPLAVASLLVELHRQARDRSALGLALQDGRGLEARVRALLDGTTVLCPRTDLGWASGTLLVLALVLPVLAAHGLHHAFESVLGLVA